MNVAARLTKFGALKTQIDPRQMQPWQRDRAQAASWDLPDPSIYENQAKLYTRLSWVHSAVTIVGQTCALQDLNVKRREGEKTKDIDNHPFELLLDKPNPLQSRFEFLRDSVSYSAINGNCYWWLNRTRPNQEPSEMWLLPSWRVMPRPDGRLYLAGYEYDPGQGVEPILLPPWQVMHFKTFNPLNEFIGLSDVEPVAIAAQTDLASQTWSGKFYGKNNARLPGILAFRDQINNEIAWQRIREDVASAAETRNILMLRGVGDRLDWIQAAASQSDMQQLEQRQFTKEEVYSVFAPGLASMLAINSTEANSKAGKQTFLEFAIWPRLVAIAQKITLDVLPVYGEKLLCEFEDPRQVDRALELQEQDAYAKTHTIDEIRSQFYEDDPLGDDRGKMLPVQVGQSTKIVDDSEPVTPAQLMPFTGQQPQPQPEAQEPDNTAEEEPEEERPEAIRSDLAAWRRKSLNALKSGRSPAVVFESAIIPPEVHADVWGQLSGCKTASDVREVFEAAMVGKQPAPPDLAAKVEALEALINKSAWVGYP